MLVTSTQRITGLHYTYGCPTLIRAYVGYLYLQNHRVTLHIWESNLKFSLCLLALPSESLGYTTLMGVQPESSLCLLGLLTESLDYTRLMGAPPKL